MQKKRSRPSSLTGPIEQSGGAPSGLNLADAKPNAGTSATVPARADGILPIVGLGGSAGGIAAMQEFFKAMPVDSGMAFVVILHLSPEHESTLPEMFQRCTPMPVVVAKDGATVEANSVYVIPPGKFLASANGHLHLAVAEEPRGKRMAVDYFFRTLAETHGAQCVGVVLSGAGGDGALGLKRIKELGGLTIAQDPDEAQHADMPRSAIATGVVDWVLGVKEMPAKLVAYMQRRAELKLPAEDGPHPAEPEESPPDEPEAALRDVLAFLRTRTGRDFSYYKRATILRRIARRMQVNGLADLPGYLGYLRTHAGEASALLQDLLISVTNFFRDPDSFTALERIVPELFAGKGPSDSVRVWVVGCATGEEAYSIAMLLCEHARTLEVPPQIQVFATDLDEDVIREARDGIYPETIATDVSEERLRRFFLHENGGYRVRREVREIVLFAPHDLLKDSPFSRLDLVSCRNLLIYLNREAQQRAFDIFYFALRPGGHLFLGTSETVEDGSPRFAVIDKKQRLYLQRPGLRQILAVPAGPSTLARALELQERSRERPTMPGRVTVEGVQAGLDKAVPFDSGLPPGELHYRLIERFSPPSILVNAAHDIVHLSDAAGRFLQIAGGEPTRNLLRAVHPMLRIELRAALYAAKQTHTTATAFHVPVETGEERSLVDIRVTPASDLAPDFLLVVFEVYPADGAAAVALPRSAEADQAAQHLERELEATKAHLRDTIEESEAATEELKASNEELQAMNEELRSATEELETSREELQSINEELTTVNDELKSNVDGLGRSNSDLQNLMAATDIATVFLDRDLRIMRFTPSATALFNFISTDLGRPLSDVTRNLDYPEIAADAARALTRLEPAEREVRAGKHFYVARAIPYRTVDDHIAGVVLTFTDITTMKDAEAAKAWLAAIVESSSDAIVSKDLRGIVTSWNDGAKDIFGYTAAEMMGQPVARLIPADRQGEEVEILRKIVAGETIKSFETVRVRKDGTTVPISVTISPIKDAAGTVIGGSKIARDISEAKNIHAALREAKETAERANQSKDRFLAVLSHELRTPLTPVLMVASALEHDPSLRPEIREDIRMIKRNVELETKLIDDLLDLSRITSGKVELKSEAVDLNAAVRQVCGICQSQVADQQIQLKIELKDDVAVISADPARLQQVLWNVLKNAIKFTPAQGTVLVTTARTGPDRCEVRVQDSGIGIPPDILPRIFNAFEQGDAHITRQFGGLGLGLAISRALVELQGGTIRAESQGQGQGATFIVELPGHPPAATVAAPAPTAARLSVTPLRLLLVEDHADTARTLARMLQAKGFAVLAVGDVASALAAAEREHFDVLVSDLGLPDGDGYEVMRAVRARCLVPGIAMSGYGMEEDMLRSADAGFTEHLVKPINVVHLIDAIRRVTDHRGGPRRA